MFATCCSVHPLHSLPEYPMRCFIAILVALGTVSFGQADAPLSAKVLDPLKAATVFVRVKAGPAEFSGSGFVIGAIEEGALIVTNEHVINPWSADRGSVEITIVFQSGRKDERVVHAAIVTADKDRDLAILKVEGVTSPP